MFLVPAWTLSTTVRLADLTPVIVGVKAVRLCSSCRDRSGASVRLPEIVHVGARYAYAGNGPSGGYLSNFRFQLGSVLPALAADLFGHPEFHVALKHASRSGYRDEASRSADRDAGFDFGAGDDGESRGSTVEADRSRSSQFAAENDHIASGCTRTGYGSDEWGQAHR